MDKRFSITLNIVKQACEQKGITLLETEYKNNHTPMKCICFCGKEYFMKWIKFQQGKTFCRDCGINKRSQKLRTPFQEIEMICKKKGLILLTSAQDYETKFVRGKIFWLSVKCENNHIILRNSQTIDDYDNNFGECRECFYEKNTGESNPFFIDGRTKENPAIRDNSLLIPWRKNVFLRDNYKCRICGINSNNLVAHHLNGYNWDLENRFNPENGITLCENHHKSFHDSYGYGNNTKEQFIEFANSF